MNKFKSTSLLTMIFIILTSIIFPYQGYADKITTDIDNGNYREYAVNGNKNGYKSIDEEKNEMKYIYDSKLTLTHAKLANILNLQSAKFYPVGSNGVCGSGCIQKTLSMNDLSSDNLKLNGLSQDPLIVANTIYLGIGWVNDFGSKSYVAMIALTVDEDGNYTLKNENGIHFFETLKPYYGAQGNNVTPPNVPVISSDGSSMMYPSSQWIINYNIINSNGSKKLEFKEAKEFIYADRDNTEHSVGGGPAYAPMNGYIYLGNWNSRMFKIKYNNISDRRTIRTDKFPVYGTDENEFIERARISSEPTVLRTNVNSRVIWGLGTNLPSKNRVGGVCSSDLNFQDIRCTIGNRYYIYNNENPSNGEDFSIVSSEILTDTSGNPEGIDAVVDSSWSWHSDYNLLFGHDRSGQIYAINAYGKVVFKEKSLKGSIAFGGVKIANDEFAYIKVNTIRDGTNYTKWGSSLYTEENCEQGRVFRIDANQIKYLHDSNPNHVVVRNAFGSNSNLRSKVDIGTSRSQILYSHKSWVTASRLVGFPFSVGNTLLATTVGCSSEGTAAALFALNIQYDNSDLKVPVKNDVRSNASEVDSEGIDASGRLNYVVDTKNNFINISGMGDFGTPIAGIKFNPNYEEGIAILTMQGVKFLYLQNSDFYITNLSATPGDDGKFYKISSMNPDAKYKGRIRAIFQPDRDYRIPLGTDLNNTKVVVKVLHTNNNITNNEDAYKCDTPNGNNPCYYQSGYTINSNYLNPNYLINYASDSNSNYSKTFRTMYTKEIPLADLPLITGITTSGQSFYKVQRGSVLIDEEFEFFINDFGNSDNQEYHHLIAYIDIQNNLTGEVSEDNNLGIRVIKYEGVPKPDLRAECSVNTPPTGTYDTNTVYSGNIRIYNNSDIPIANGFDYKITRDFTSNDVFSILKSQYPNGDTFLSGEYINVPFNFSFSTNGAHTLNIDINHQRNTGNIKETTYTNNTCDFNIKIGNTDMKPDLASISVGTTDDNYAFNFSGTTVTDGFDIPIRGVIQNVGEENIIVNSDSYLRVRRNGTQIIEVTQNCKAIVKSNESCYVGVILPESTIREGTYDVYMRADNSNVINEKSETNNIATSMFTVENSTTTTVPSGTFSPNDGGIKDTIGMALDSNDLDISSYTIDYTIGIYNSSNILIRTLATNSTASRYPHVGQNPHDVSDISTYQSNYLNSNNALNSWNSIPKTDGLYIWDGKNDSGLVEPDGDYKIGIRYQYESTNPNHVDWLVPNGCSYCDEYEYIYYDDENPTEGGYYSCVDYEDYDCYKHISPYYNCYYGSSSFPTSSNYGTEVRIDNNLRLDNVEIIPEPGDDGTVRNTIKSSEHVYIPDTITTRLEASEVTVTFPDTLIDTSFLTPSTYTRSGNDIIISLVPKWSTVYNINDNFRCNDGDPYCNTWGLRNGDALVIQKLATDGEYNIIFRARTRLDTPNSPVTESVKLRIQDAIYNYIKVEEKNNGNIPSD